MSLEGYLGSQSVLFVQHDPGGQSETEYFVLEATTNSATGFWEENRDPALVEVFARQWAEVCAALGARHAFFSFIRTDVLALPEGYPRVTDDLRQGDVNSLVTNAYFLSYFDADLARRADSAQVAVPKKIERVVRMSSGGLLLVADDPSTGWMALAWQARWILANLRMGPSVEGVPDMMAELQDALDTGIPAIVSERETLGTQVEQAHSQRPDVPVWQLNEEIESPMRVRVGQMQAYLSRTRALWAAARERPGLVALNQPLAGGPPLVVPIVAAGGREWIEVVTHDPRAYVEPLEDEVKQPLDLRARKLVAAAWAHPVDGAPPRVVLYWYHPPTDEVRAQLEAEGVAVEVAPLPVPLLPASPFYEPPEEWWY